MSSVSFKKWLVALDRSEMDQRIISNVRFWATLLKPEQIDFISIQIDDKEWEEVDPSLYEKFKLKLRESDRKWIDAVTEQTQDYPCSTKLHVQYGNSLVELIEVTHQGNYDLVVCGKKQAIQSTGQLTEELAKEIQASFLLIPETALAQCKRLLVPSDCSEHSNLAFDTAMLIKGQKPSTKIYTTTIYDVPQGYHTIGLSLEEAAYNRQQNCQKKLTAQLSKLGYQADETILRQKTRRSNAEQIQQIASDLHADLIVTGSKGMSASAYILMGTTASRMMRHMGRAPLLIIKRKGETMDFLTALGKLMNPE